MKNFPILYVLDLTSQQSGLSLKSDVSKMDLEYCKRFRNPRRKEQSLICRKLAREALFDVTGINYADWEFHVSKVGARYAQSQSGEQLHVSFSHCKKYCVAAIGKGAIGVDVEQVKEERPWRQMASFFERPDFVPPYETQLDFLRGWTAYEAQFKYSSASNSPSDFFYFNPSIDTVLCVSVEERESNSPPSMFVIK